MTMHFEEVGADTTLCGAHRDSGSGDLPRNVTRVAAAVTCGRCNRSLASVSATITRLIRESVAPTGRR